VIRPCNANPECAAGDTRRRSRSPARGPRAGERERDRDRGKEGDNRERGARGPKTNGVSQQSNSHASTSKPSAGRRGGPNGEVAERDTAMTNGDTDSGDEDAMLRRMMGFEAFRTTKNTKVPGNHKNYGVRKDKKTEYRQYMNRQGGFNRPLSPS
jgi:U4/U6.U5 tri-snRNP-associated protein 3